MFDNSCRALLTFIDDILSQYPVNPKKLMLFGFSMGSVMSFAMGLSQPQLFRGVVAHSGYLPEGTHLHLRWNELGNTDFFIAHGIADPVIPIALARRAKELFDKSTASVVYREYPMAHQISEESLADASGWISQRISG
jgi:phospholipase/carboxylesterase